MLRGVGLVDKGLVDELCAAVKESESELVAFTQALVRRPSLPDGEGPAQELVADALGGLGLGVDVLPCRFDELREHAAFTDDGFSPDGRVDVIGRWRGSGGGRSLVLNGHVDVVPEGDPTLWSRPPWSGDVAEGAVYGRGACDMKGGLAAAVFAVGAAKRIGIQPKGDVVVQSVVGEETGGIGTLAAIVHGLTADAAVILEPTGLVACHVQSGALTFRLTVRGRATHGATRLDGVSALDKLRLVLDALDRLESGRGAERTAPISVGTVHGGGWPSTVPDEVVVEGRYGVLPGEDVAAARQRFDASLAEAAAGDEWLASHPPELAWIEGQFESGATPADAPIIGALGAAHETVTGSGLGLGAVPYGSDLRLFTNHAAMPAVLYGPGDVRLAHAVDEHVAIGEVVTATQVACVLLAQWCG
jgi:acetylornithine deacetylase